MKRQRLQRSASVLMALILVLSLAACMSNNQKNTPPQDSDPGYAE